MRGSRLGRGAATAIHTAEFDPLRDEGRAYAERLELAGVHASYRCHPGMIHLFYGMGGVIPDARGCWSRSSRFGPLATGRLRRRRRVLYNSIVRSRRVRVRLPV